MLIECPECSLQISDKAFSCPHCGNPMRLSENGKKPRKAAKRRRLPNGFGQISEIQGRNLRKPFRAMVTTGKTPEGRPIQKMLKPDAYFATYNEAYEALVEYNKNPCDLDPAITVGELYDKWSAEYEKTVSPRTYYNTVYVWSYCDEVKKMRVKDLRVRHIKRCLNDGVSVKDGIEKHTTPNVKHRIKVLFDLMLDYAVEYELVEQNYARTFGLTKGISKDEDEQKKPHIDFTDEEMKILWDNVDFPNVDMLLIQCYTGWRPLELCRLELKNIDLKNKQMTGGMKTAAGTNRTIPIHSKIYDLVKARYEQATSLGSEYLFNCYNISTKQYTFSCTYTQYQRRFNQIIERFKFDPNHRPHDPRVQFVTMAKKYQVDEYAIKYIVGHSIEDLTERIYTKRNLDWLSQEIEKIR